MKVDKLDKLVRQEAESIVRAYGYHEGEVIDFDTVIEMVCDALYSK